MQMQILIQCGNSTTDQNCKTGALCNFTLYQGGKSWIFLIALSQKSLCNHKNHFAIKAITPFWLEGKVQD
jgi:hypothetical protein